MRVFGAGSLRTVQVATVLKPLRISNGAGVMPYWRHCVPQQLYIACAWLRPCHTRLASCFGHPRLTVHQRSHHAVANKFIVVPPYVQGDRATFRPDSYFSRSVRASASISSAKLAKNRVYRKAQYRELFALVSSASFACRRKIELPKPERRQVFWTRLAPGRAVFSCSVGFLFLRHAPGCDHGTIDKCRMAISDLKVTRLTSALMAHQR